MRDSKGRNDPVAFYYGRIGEYDLAVGRTCRSCGTRYRISDYELNAEYFAPPYLYIRGCEECCLTCWLVPPEDGQESLGEFNDDNDGRLPVKFYDSRRPEEYWDFLEYYPLLANGDLIGGYSWFLDRGWSLLIMPTVRLHLAKSVFFPDGIGLFRAGLCELDALRPRLPSLDGTELSEACSAKSGVSLDFFSREALFALPCKLDSSRLKTLSHKLQLEFVRDVSDWISYRALSYLCFKYGNLDSIESAPCHPGQSKNGYTAAMVYPCEEREAIVLAGSVFPSVITQGIGLTARQPEWDSMPLDSEVGHILDHALLLYSNLLGTSCQTSKFVQAMSLLEYLSLPFEYIQFKKIRPILTNYVARSSDHHAELNQRFKTEIFGKEGLRTQVVHHGKRLEDVVVSPTKRAQLFRELESYIRPIIEHLLSNSEKSWEQYVEVRDRTFPLYSQNESNGESGSHDSQATRVKLSRKDRRRKRKCSQCGLNYRLSDYWEMREDLLQTYLSKWSAQCFDCSEPVSGCDPD